MAAGMAGVTSPDFVAAASNAGGIGTIGAIGLSPESLRQQIIETQKLLKRPDLPFGVDLLLPKVGKGAKKTNKDYTGGKLGELLDICIELKVPLFVCAVGVPPAWACEKLHAHGIVVMNMIGDPRHCLKALEMGVDLICAQGTEGGGHTGEIATMPLVPQCVKLVQGRTNFFGTPVQIIAAGGIYNGAGMAAALAMGATGVWVGTALLCAEECNVQPAYQQAIIQSSSADTMVQRYYSGRTMRVISNEWVRKWRKKDGEANELLDEGMLPSMNDMGEDDSLEMQHTFGSLLFPDDAPVDRKSEESISNFKLEFSPMLAGQSIGGVKSVRPMAVILEEMLSEAISIMKVQSSMIQSRL